MFIIYFERKNAYFFHLSCAFLYATWIREILFCVYIVGICYRFLWFISINWIRGKKQLSRFVWILWKTPGTGKGAEYNSPPPFPFHGNGNSDLKFKVPKINFGHPLPRKQKQIGSFLGDSYTSACTLYNYPLN